MRNAWLLSKIKVLADVSISKIVLFLIKMFQEFASCVVFISSGASLLLVGENANVVVYEACREADFKGMERETRRLADPRAHETLMTLNRADLCSVKSVN